MDIFVRFYDINGGLIDKIPVGSDGYLNQSDILEPWEAGQNEEFIAIAWDTDLSQAITVDTDVNPIKAPTFNYLKSLVNSEAGLAQAKALLNGVENDKYKSVTADTYAFLEQLYAENNGLLDTGFTNYIGFTGGDDAVPDGWTDDPVGISNEYRYEYVSKRKTYYDNGVKKWGNFSAPAIWSMYVEGQAGADGHDGHDGRDGTNGTSINNVEEYYRAVRTTGMPSKTPKSNWTLNEIPSNYGPVDKYLWNYEVFLSDDGRVSASTEPALIATQGKSILRIEEYYAVSNSDTEIPSDSDVYPKPSDLTLDGNRIDNITAVSITGSSTFIVYKVTTKNTTDVYWCYRENLNVSTPLVKGTAVISVYDANTFASFHNISSASEFVSGLEDIEGPYVYPQKCLPSWSKIQSAVTNGVNYTCLWNQEVVIYDDKTHEMHSPAIIGYKYDASNISIPITRYRGAWDSSKEYVSNSRYIDLVYYDNGDGGLFFKVIPGHVNTGISSVPSGNNIDTIWEAIGNDYEQVATDFLFANNAIVHNITVDKLNTSPDNNGASIRAAGDSLWAVDEYGVPYMSCTGKYFEDVNSFVTAGGVSTKYNLDLVKAYNGSFTKTATTTNLNTSISETIDIPLNLVTGLTTGFTSGSVSISYSIISGQSTNNAVAYSISNINWSYVIKEGYTEYGSFSKNMGNTITLNNTSIRANGAYISGTSRFLVTVNIPESVLSTVYTDEYNRYKNNWCTNWAQANPLDDRTPQQAWISDETNDYNAQVAGNLARTTFIDSCRDYSVKIEVSGKLYITDIKEESSIFANGIGYKKDASNYFVVMRGGDNRTNNNKNNLVLEFASGQYKFQFSSDGFKITSGNITKSYNPVSGNFS